MEVVESLHTTTVNVNVVAATAMRKALQRVAELAGLGTVPRQTLVDLARSSGGDVRHAVGALQVASLGGTAAPAPPSRAKRGRGRRRGRSWGFAHAQSREPALSAVHGIGRLLHAKRTGEAPVPADTASARLFAARPPLEHEPEGVAEYASLPEDMLVAFLHESAPAFWSAETDTAAGMELLAATADDFSLCDCWHEHGAGWKGPFRGRAQGLQAGGAVYPLACIRSLASRTVAARNACPRRGSWMRMRAPSRIRVARCVLCTPTHAELSVWLPTLHCPYLTRHPYSPVQPSGSNARAGDCRFFYGPAGLRRCARHWYRRRHRPRSAPQPWDHDM